MKGDAEGEVDSCQDDGPFEFTEQEVDQARLEDEGVEEHEENDDDVEEDSNILDAADIQNRAQPNGGLCEKLRAGPMSCWTSSPMTTLLKR